MRAVAERGAGWSSGPVVNIVTSENAIVVGGGHNGMVAAAYLAKAGRRVLVLERRHLVGGAAVTEEIVPGFKFSRASYVFSLFRPQIVKDLDLKRHGLKVFPRNPSSFTPMMDGRSLTLGGNMEMNVEQISQFSKLDAAAYPEYNDVLDRCVSFFQPFLDMPPPDFKVLFGNYSAAEKMRVARDFAAFGKGLVQLGPDIPNFLEVLTAPATSILNKWFESEPLKTTLATDAIIGTCNSPSTPTSAYVLFHHIMGEVDGVKGVWGYVQGGMGAVSNAIASAATEAGVTIQTNATVKQILTAQGPEGSVARGVELADGTVLESDIVISNAAPRTTFMELLPLSALPPDFAHRIATMDNRSCVMKINVAVSRLPNFLCKPNTGDGNTPMPHHRCTIHFEENMEQLEEAHRDSVKGIASRRPIIELTIPSSLDPTISPKGAHVVLLFVQYCPYDVKGGWTEEAKNAFADRVFDVIEQYAPGFKASVVGRDVLSPLDLEQIFGLPQGNIFHTGMGLDQLFWLRPAAGYSRYRTPVKNLFMCGAGTHPGGGVMGAAGRNAANEILHG